MEERINVMTDHQWDGMIKMMLKILKHCDTKEEAIDEISDLLREELPKTGARPPS